MFGHTLTTVLYFGQRVGGFPNELVPDGTIVAPHHYIIGLLVVGFALYLTPDDDKKPYTVAAFATSAFAWSHLWAGPSPFLGAVGTVGGLVVGLIAVLWASEWSDDRWTADTDGRLRRLLTPRLWAFIGLLVALDDAVEHAFGVWTPLDWFWGAFLHPWLTDAVRWLSTLL